MSGFETVAAEGGGRRGARAAAARGGATTNSAFGAVASGPSSTAPHATSPLLGSSSDPISALCSRVETDLSKLSLDMAQLNRLADSMSKGSTTAAEGKSRVSDLMDDCMSCLRYLKSALNDQFPKLIESTISAAQKSNARAKHKRYTEELQKHLALFQTVSKNVKVAASKAAKTEEYGTAGKDSYQHNPQLQVLDERVNLTEALVNERADAVDAISATVLEVNEAFREVAGLVAAQQEGLNAMEKNVDSANDHMVSGNKELTEAAKHQKRYRKCLLLLLAIVILIAAGLTAYFVISNKK